jgi:hypothetical protein
MIAHRYVHMEALLDGWRLFLMNDHLDECPEVFIDCFGTLCDCEYFHFCICDALRACEERVRGEEQQRIEAALRSVGQHDVAWELAIRESTLREAVQRVEALNFWEEHVREFVHRDEAIAAIKGDQP